MPEVTLYNMQGAELGSLSLPEEVFGIAPNVALIHQAVTTEEANMRQGTHATKTRGNVRGGGKKPWRQKGTGRARQGSTRAPHWRHGGVVFGPHPRSYRKALPREMRRGAIRSALSARVADGELIAIDSFALPEISTKAAVAALGALPLSRDVKTRYYNASERVEQTSKRPHKVLLIVPAYDPVLVKSLRNVPEVTLRYAPNFSVRDVMAAGRIVLAQGALETIQAVLARTFELVNDEESAAEEVAAQ